MDRNKISVIIADDNKEFCSILNDYLLNQRDIVVTGIAKDGREALTLIEEKQPDLVVLDIIMPHLDGLGVLEKLNSMNLEKFPEYFFILLNSILHMQLVILSKNSKSWDITTNAFLKFFR